MRFRNEYYFLSNMFPASVSLAAGGKTLTFPCAESAFQAMKCPDRVNEFLHLDGYKAKKLGRRVSLRPDWEDVKIPLMTEIVKSKFANPVLKAKLLATGDLELVEHNSWGDRFWGVDERTGQGRNELGKILMAVRTELADKS